VVKTIIHVNQHVIANNRKTGQADPPLTVKTYKSNQLGSGVVLRDTSGAEVARIVYRPHDPLPCGARLWIETDSSRVEVV
jgi:hypothetical protein